MKSDFEPIIFNAPRDAHEIVIHAIHDLHYGNQCFDKGRWDNILSELQKPNHYAIFVGDLMENAIVGGKSDVLYQTCPPIRPARLGGRPIPSDWNRQNHRSDRRQP